MKRLVLILLCLTMVFGMAACSMEADMEDEMMIQDEPDVDDSDEIVKDIESEPVDQEETDEDTEEESDMLEPINITGIVIDVNDNMVTLDGVEGIEGTYRLVVILADDMAVEVRNGQFMNVIVSPMMTRSLPPQSPVVEIVSLNDVVLGEVLEVTESGYIIRPISEFYNFDEMVIHIGEDTLFDVERDNISKGSYIRIMIDNVMTASIPPQVGALRVLSIETHD